MPAGRPTSYKPEYCDAVVEHMAEGASLTSFAASVGVCRDTVSEWCSVYPEFSVSVKRGKAACAAWWEKTGRTQALDGKGNATLVIFGLKNMAAEDWRDKTQTELTGANGAPLQVEAIERRIVKTGQ